MNKMLRGTLILSASIFISKFLGMIYIFPFNALVGVEGGVLYSYAYVPYMIMISISTLGIPLGVSKFVAKYNALGDYETGRRLFYSGIVVMSGAGVLSFLSLYFFAPVLAPLIVKEGAGSGNTISEVVFVIRMVSFALIIFPVMSLIRGYFQGFQSMGPTAVSQVVEQIIRIIIILVGSYLVIRVYKGDIATAIGISTFAAFIGGLVAFASLLIYWKKRQPYLKEQYKNSVTKEKMPLGKMYKELISYALPFVFVGIAIPAYQLIDTFTFNRALIAAGHTQAYAEEAQSVINFYGHKLVMIPVSLATALSLSLIPAITKSFTEKNIPILHRQISQTFQVIMFLILPIAIGMSILSDELYGLFYGLDDMKVGGALLKLYAPVAILFALFTVTTSILQGINQQRFALWSLSSGVLLKLSFNTMLLKQFNEFGSVYATTIGFGFSVLFNLLVIKKYANYNFRMIGKQGVQIVVVTIVMVVTALLARNGMEHVVGKDRLDLLFILFISSLSGGLIYIIITYRLQLLQNLIGDKLPFLRRTKKEG